MHRKPLIFSLICTALITIAGLHTWLTLPELDQYPIHWNAAGEADGFADKNGVIGVLMIMPATLLFITAILYAIPKIEPLRQNFEDSRKAYNIVWVTTMALMTAVGAFIIMPYQYELKASSVHIGIKAVSAGIGLLFIVIGNMFGKIRPNFMFGIRTPWTLSSDLSWEKTHRLGGRLFVATGLVGIFLSIFSPPDYAILGTVGVLLTIVIICCVYSYQIWKADPDKRK